MAKLKLKFRDVSRMTKKYPYTRHLPRTQLVSDKEFELEVMTVEVANLEEKVIEWSVAFNGVPNVTATIVLSKVADEDKANVNMWVKTANETGCTLAFSDAFTGTVNVQAIRFS